MPGVRELNISMELWSMVFCAVCIVCCLLLVRTRSRMRALIVAGLSLEFVAAGCDALAGIFRGREGDLAWAMTRVGSALSFIVCFFLLAMFTNYLCLRMRDAGSSYRRRWQIGVWVAAAVMSVLALTGMLFYFDDANVYHRGVGYLLVPAYVIAVNGVNVVFVLKSRRQLGNAAFACILFYLLAPVAAVIAQAVFYGADFVIVAAVLGFAVIFLEMLSHSFQVLADQAAELAASRIEISDSRIRVMVAQMQPHFMFNTLDTIYGLIDEDPALAQEAIASFSRYVRANLQSLNQSAPVPVEREMEHVRTYLELERVGDPDRISFSFDVEATGFSVPVLSVQTIAENAVRHGIGARPEGGTVTVRTRELPGEFTVTVADDGVGFDEAVVASDGVDHLGIENTRKRLAALCGGRLEVESATGEGCRVVMYLPKEKERR